MLAIVRTPDFHEWLTSSVGLTAKSARDVNSRLRRASMLADVRPDMPEDEALMLLSRSPGFQCLSVTVRSQLRRALKLFFTYTREAPYHPRLPV